MDDCDMTKYGHQCTKTCTCTKTELCHNINGSCYAKNDHVFKINLNYNRYTLNYFQREQETLKENTALLIWTCLKGEDIDPYCMGNNTFNYSRFPGVRKENEEEHIKSIKLLNTFFVRIVHMDSMFSFENEEVLVVTMTLLNNSIPVNGSLIEQLLINIPKDALSRALGYEYYKGETYMTKRPTPPFLVKMKWIVIGLSSKFAFCLFGSTFPPPLFFLYFLQISLKN